MSKASVKFLATLGPHVKLPTEMSNFPTLGGPPGANVKLSKGSVKVYAWLGPYYPPHATVEYVQRGQGYESLRVSVNAVHVWVNRVLSPLGYGTTSPVCGVGKVVARRPSRRRLEAARAAPAGRPGPRGAACGCAALLR